MATNRTNSRPAWSTRKKIVVALIIILVALVALVWVPRMFAGSGEGQGGTTDGTVSSSSLIKR